MKEYSVIHNSIVDDGGVYDAESPEEAYATHKTMGNSNTSYHIILEKAKAEIQRVKDTAVHENQFLPGSFVIGDYEINILQAPPLKECNSCPAYQNICESSNKGDFACTEFQSKLLFYKKRV